MFRYITLPLITPFLFIAAMIRMIDAVKSFDIIFAITQGGPGSASETINLYLYSVAFVYYDVGYGSAIARRVLRADRRACGRCCSTCASARTGPRPEAAHEPAADPRQDRPLVRGVRHRLAGDPVLPLDDLAVAQIRDRQRRLSAGLHPRALRLEELCRRARLEPLLDLFPQQPDRHRHGDRCSRCWSACRPATASRA